MLNGKKLFVDPKSKFQFIDTAEVAEIILEILKEKLKIVFLIYLAKVI